MGADNIGRLKKRGEILVNLRFVGVELLLIFLECAALTGVCPLCVCAN